MRHPAEINRFAIFLFCSLVPLGSLAPTAMSEESKTTVGQRQKFTTTRIKIAASVIENKATTLFKHYNECSPVTPLTASWLRAASQVKAMVKKIPECPDPAADCCTLHVLSEILQELRSGVEEMCGKNLTQLVDANISQLNVSLRDGSVPYTCENQDLLQLNQSQLQGMRPAEKKMYTWQVLQKYEEFMKNTTKIYS